jgi:hypothetical protein
MGVREDGGWGVKMEEAKPAVAAAGAALVGIGGAPAMEVLGGGGARG